MADLPSYVTVRMSGYEEEIEPSVERVDMERGPAKQTILNSQVVVNLHLALLFHTTAEHESFFAWYMDTIKRVDYFDMTHPRTGATIAVRFPGGSIGSLRSIAGTDHLWQRDVTVEYLR